MPIKAVQQFMLGTVMNKEAQARETMEQMKAAGYDGIELCGFMIHPSGFLVKMMTKAAGMPVGNGGKLDWPRLVKESGLKVVSIHQDLGSVERNPAAVAEEAELFGTDRIVITGMYRPTNFRQFQRLIHYLLPLKYGSLQKKFFLLVHWSLYFRQALKE